MSWAIIEGPMGKRLLEPGRAHVFEPGEVIIAVLPDKPNGISGQEDTIDKLAHHFGMNVADFIEKAAATLHAKTGLEIFKHCPLCEMRKRFLYGVDKLGWTTTLKLLWSTFQSK